VLKFGASPTRSLVARLLLFFQGDTSVNSNIITPTATKLGVLGAIMMGLGSIIGTGVFVSIGIAAGIAGPAVILAVAIAALVATCNGLNSAQLAANHAVSGGTYEYGYKLTPWLGFTAGWMFLVAKTASAATAALASQATCSMLWICQHEI